MKRTVIMIISIIGCIIFGFATLIFGIAAISSLFSDIGTAIAGFILTLIPLSLLCLSIFGIVTASKKSKPQQNSPIAQSKQNPTQFPKPVQRNIRPNHSTFTKKSLILKTTNEEIINKENIKSSFELDSLIERKEGGFYYLLNYQNTKIALSLLPELNRLSKEAKKLYSPIPARQFTESQFTKQKITTKYDEYYTLQLYFNPLTKTKKELSKYPFTISFYPNDRLFANVSYNKVGTVEKVELTIWSDICYLVNAIEKDNILTIKSIYQDDFSGKTKVYSE